MFRIMVVEDEPLILQSICEKIRSSDPDFRIAGEYENGEYAMLELDLIKPHVLLTDIYMPVMDGLSLIEYVKKNAPSTICAVLTGYRDFEYAKKAIELGVSDYLLKPPTVENIAKFLAEVKTKLWKNQTMVETEMLQQWAFHKDDDEAYSVNIRRMAHEYFYHVRYIVLYSWMPPQQQHAQSGQEDKWNVDALLHDSEKSYLIPSVSNNQKIIVVGVHSFSDARLLEFAEFGASQLQYGSACVAAASIGKLQTELFSILAKLHKKVYAGYPLQGTKCLIIQGNEYSYEVPTIPIPTGLEQDMSLLLFKQRKTEFMKKLDMLFQLETWSASTRLQWLQTLSYLMNSWMLQQPELAKKAVQIHWYDELEAAIWQAQDLLSMIQGLKELHSSLFDAFDQDPGVGAPWTDELKNYLETSYIDNITLNDLAERFNLNPSYLGRVFKRRYGHSPIDYLIQVRLAKAKQLIREKPRLLFKEVAEIVGYNDPFYFSKLFKQWTGLTPREYKKLPTSE